VNPPFVGEEPDELAPRHEPAVASAAASVAIKRTRRVVRSARARVLPPYLLSGHKALTSSSRMSAAYLRVQPQPVESPAVAVGVPAVMLLRSLKCARQS